VTAPFAERLARLRGELQEQGVDGFVLQRTDQHGSEYLPPGEERLAWLTGFTGSAGQAVILTAAAAVFTDGRYSVQIAHEVDEALFERCHITDHPPSRWLRTHLDAEMVLGYDPRLTRKAERERLARLCRDRDVKLVPLDANPVDRVWDDRPPPPRRPVRRHEERFAGESSAAKRQRLGEAVGKAGADWLLVTAADSIAWLLNVRGGDVPFNPLCLSHLLLGADGRVLWFVDSAKLAINPADSSPPVDDTVEIRAYRAIDDELAGLGLAGAKILVDPALNAVGFADLLRSSGGHVIEGTDPIPAAKACKNETEIKGALDAQRRDGAAMARFLAWLEGLPLDGSIDELAAAARLQEERARDPLFRGPSFETISAHGPNAALPHYRVSEASNRPLLPGTLYLVDSGGQYLDGTTDITRTMALGHPSTEMQSRFTLVLKGLIALSEAVFPTGTSGSQLDLLARQFLWRRGLDYDHGTGHGIGSYLCVHEGPQRLAKRGGDAPLEPGMILSNEPGYYQPGEYGIRIENLILVERAAMPEDGDRELLCFRTMTLAPIDRRLIDLHQLSEAERLWIDAYHDRVRDELWPQLDDATRAWLEQATGPL
jgi:Xaa-Pro aminopeptidase